MATLYWERLDDQFAVVGFHSGGYGVIDRTAHDHHHSENNLLKKEHATAEEAAQAWQYMDENGVDPDADFA